MDESVLIKTFDMLIDQLNKLAIQTNTIEEHLKHESRYKCNDERIFGRLFGFPFNMSSFDWHPSCNGGHIQIVLKESKLYDYWCNLWEEEKNTDFTEKDMILMNELSTHIKTLLKEDQYELLFKNMTSDDNDESQFQSSEYGIECLHHEIDEYIISSFAKSKVTSPYITSCNYTRECITIYFNNNNVYGYKKPFKAISDFSIDTVSEYILDVFACLGIVPDAIKHIQYTAVDGYVRKILEIYDIELAQQEVREKLVKDYIKSLPEYGRSFLKKQLLEFDEKMCQRKEHFNSELTSNHDELYWVLQIIQNIDEDNDSSDVDSEDSDD